LDSREECFGFFYDGEIHQEELKEEYFRTWSPTSSVKGDSYEYAKVLCGGKTLEEACPKHLRGEFLKRRERLLAFRRSFNAAKINLSEHCFYDMVPLSDIKKYFLVQNKIVEHVFKTYDKLENFHHQCRMLEFFNDLSSKEIKTNTKNLLSSASTPKVRKFLQTFHKTYSNKIKYNFLRTKTGRLTTDSVSDLEGALFDEFFELATQYNNKKRSFPALTLDADFRSLITPDNDLIAELDFNAAELRVFLSLSGKEQPQGDLHEWNSTFLNVDRQRAKRSVIAYMYGDRNSEIGELEKLYNVNVVKEKFFDPKSEIAKTHFGKRIQTDDFRAVNHIIQGTAAEMVMRQLLKVEKLLTNRKSYVKMCLHDSVIIDLSREDMDLFIDIVNTFSNTELGEYPCKVKAGKNFGDMKEIQI
jgi:hypothetical protein